MIMMIMMMMTTFAIACHLHDVRAFCPHILTRPNPSVDPTHCLNLRRIYRNTQICKAEEVNNVCQSWIFIARGKPFRPNTISISNIHEQSISVTYEATIERSTFHWSETVLQVTWFHFSQWWLTSISADETANENLTLAEVCSRSSEI